MCLAMPQSLEDLRRRHPRFVYEKVEHAFDGNDLTVTFSFTLEPNIHFQPRIVFHTVSKEKWETIDKKLVENWLFAIGMVESLSYWKAACAPDFIIRAGFFNETQLSFWKKLLHKGLSEFFFINKIDGWREDFVRFSVEAESISQTFETQKPSIAPAHHILIPIGGGKDSIVTLELLKQSQEKLVSFAMNEDDRIAAVRELAQLPEHIAVTRKLDPQILELNARGYLNGHTPYVALLSFISTCAAYLFGLDSVALSNEWSANEGNTLFLGQQINHQYSKTVEFEKDFREYLSEFLPSGIQYFSFLRPLHELQIAHIFSRYPQYFSAFLSCNRGKKTGQWCGECPKCLFVYIMLSAFLEPQQVEAIFGQNLFAKDSLKPLLEELSGAVECKSFECVGTRQETLAALALILEKYKGSSFPSLLGYAKNTLLTNLEETKKDVLNILSSFQKEHFIPPKLVDILRKNI